MDNSLENKATIEINHENYVCLTNTTKSSTVHEKKKFAVEKDDKNYECNLLKNKTVRSGRKTF